MIKKIINHPYYVTTVVFIAVIFFGVFFLQWREDYLLNFLLLYFIIILGIRLDDISEQIGSKKRKLKDDNDESVIGQLKEITTSMKIIEKQLSGIFMMLQTQRIISKIEEEENETKEK